MRGLGRTFIVFPLLFGGMVQVQGQEAVSLKTGTVKNSIVWSNRASDSTVMATSFKEGVAVATSCTTEDPLVYPDFRLKPESPCINRSDVTAITAGKELDLRGEWRVIGGKADIGALESATTVHTGEVVYVKQGATGSGSSWEDAIGSLNAALSIAGNSKSVWVSQGEYRPIDELMIPAGVVFLGGFEGVESVATARKAADNICILNGGGTHRVATVEGVIEGFLLKNGSTPENGGGVLLKSGGMVRNCKITGNWCGREGGGVYAEGGTVAGCLIEGNGSCGDGCAVGGTNWELVNNTIVENSFLDKVELANWAITVRAGVAASELVYPTISKAFGSPYFHIGWKLDDNELESGYRLGSDDNGKMLQSVVTNRCGETESNKVTISGL